MIEGVDHALLADQGLRIGTEVDEVVDGIVVHVVVPHRVQGDQLILLGDIRRGDVAQHIGGLESRIFAETLDGQGLDCPTHERASILGGMDGGEVPSLRILDRDRFGEVVYPAAVGVKHHGIGDLLPLGVQRHIRVDRKGSAGRVLVAGAVVALAPLLHDVPLLDVLGDRGGQGDGPVLPHGIQGDLTGGEVGVRSCQVDLLAAVELDLGAALLGGPTDQAEGHGLVVVVADAIAVDIADGDRRGQVPVDLVQTALVLVLLVVGAVDSVRGVAGVVGDLVEVPMGVKDLLLGPLELLEIELDRILGIVGVAAVGLVVPTFEAVAQTGNHIQDVAVGVALLDDQRGGRVLPVVVVEHHLKLVGQQLAVVPADQVAQNAHHVRVVDATVEVDVAVELASLLILGGQTAVAGLGDEHRVEDVHHLVPVDVAREVIGDRDLAVKTDDVDGLAEIVGEAIVREGIAHQDAVYVARLGHLGGAEDQLDEVAARGPLGLGTGARKVASAIAVPVFEAIHRVLQQVALSPIHQLQSLVVFDAERNRGDTRVVEQLHEHGDRGVGQGVRTADDDLGQIGQILQLRLLLVTANATGLDQITAALGIEPNVLLGGLTAHAIVHVVVTVIGVVGVAQSGDRVAVIDDLEAVLAVGVARVAVLQTGGAHPHVILLDGVDARTNAVDDDPVIKRIQFDVVVVVGRHVVVAIVVAAQFAHVEVVPHALASGGHDDG